MEVSKIPDSNFHVNSSLQYRIKQWVSWHFIWAGNHGGLTAIAHYLQLALTLLDLIFFGLLFDASSIIP